MESDDTTTTGMKLNYWKNYNLNLNHYLEKVNWAEALGQLNIDEAGEKFKTIIHNDVHRFVLMK